MQNKNNFFINNGIYCINVYGSSYKSGIQIGRVLKDYLDGSVIDFFNKIVFKEISNGIIPNSIKFKSYINKIPQSIKDELRGFSESAKLDLNNLYLHHLLPEIIYDKVYKKHDYPFLKNSYINDLSQFGCSSIIGNHNENLIIGRNSDIFLNGYWDKKPLVIYYHPEKDNKYVSITSVGFSGLITGINDKNLIYILHKNNSDHMYSKDFTPILSLGHIVLNQANNIDSAIEIIKSNNFLGSWSILLVDSNKKETCIVEICNNEIEIIKESKVLTNSFINSKFQEEEIILNPLLSISSNYRKIKLKSFLDNINNISPEIMANILGDKTDYLTKKEKIFAYSISQNHTVSSVIFKPSSKTFWVANGICPVSNNKYIPFPIEFNNNRKLPTADLNRESFEIKNISDDQYNTYLIKESMFKNENFSKSLIILQEVNYLYLNNEYYQSLEYLYRLEKIADNDLSVVYFLIGSLNLILGNYEKSLDYLKKSFEIETDIYRATLVKLWLGRLYDLLKDRENAIKQYNYVAQMNKEIYLNLVLKAQKHLTKIFKKSDLKKIKLNICLGDEIEV